jgi:hypothetical protein
VILYSAELAGREANHKRCSARGQNWKKTELRTVPMSNRDFPVRFRRLVAALALVLAAGAFAAGDDYRLAGIIAVAPDRLIAVIEMPDGRQGLFRAGDTLGEGRIREISRAGVRVETKDGDVLLSLRGNPRLSAAAPIIDEGDVVEQVAEETPAVRNQPLFYEDTVKLLTSVARASTAQAPPAGAATATGEAGASVDALTARLGELLGVPAGARIVAVDRDAVHSPQEVIDAVIPRLNSGRAVRLSLTGAGELQALYLTPVEEE